MSSISFADLFCGAGLGARGAVNAGATPLFAVDAWDRAAETYKANFPEAEVLSRRIEEVDPRELARRYRPDVLLTSPECTSHSIARGSRPGCELSRATAIGIVPWVKALKPRWVIVENVIRMKQWDRHEELVGSIARMGYHVNNLYLNAADFGTAQSRRRMFLICDKKGSVVTKDDLLKFGGHERRNAASIIDWSGRYRSTPLYNGRRAQPTLERAERAMKALGRNVPFLIVYYGSDHAGGWQSIDVPLRTVTTVDRFGLVTWKEDQPLLRMLQPDELLAAMGAGSDHILPYGTRRDKVRLCGNGICSSVMEAVFRWIAHIEERQLSAAS